MEFNVGDLVRCVARGEVGGGPQEGYAYTVEHVTWDGCVALCGVTGVWYTNRFVHLEQPTHAFKIGDKVRFKWEPCSAPPMTVERQPGGMGLGLKGGLWADVCLPNSWSWYDVVLVERSEEIPLGEAPKCDSMPPLRPAFLPLVGERSHEPSPLYSGGRASVTLDEALKSNPAQALRFNTNKPESDYILTYAGGIKATFDEDFDYYGTLETLADVYSSKTLPDCSLGALINTLRADANDCGDDIVDRLAETNTKGGKKYKVVGNYLKGANWRQYFQAAVRHAQHLQNGDERDAEGFSHRGNFFFNVLALHHCITTGIGTDDRVKAPK